MNAAESVFSAAPLRPSITDRLAAGIAELPRRLHALLLLSGGRWAFAWSSYAFMFVPASLAVAALEAPTGFTTLGSLGVGFLSVTVSLLAGVIYVALFMRHRAKRPASLAVQIGFWLTCGLGLGLARTFSVIEWTDADPQIVLRLIGSVAGSAVWVPASAVVQSMLERRRERMDELESVRRRLERIQQSAETSLEEQVAALSNAVRTTVEPHIARLSEKVAALNGGLTRNMLKRLASDIETVSGDVVRLASHRAAEPGDSGIAHEPRRPRILNGVALDVLKRPIVWPWVGSLMIIVGTGPEIYRTSGGWVVLLGTVSVVVSTVILTLAEHYTARLDNRRAAWLQWGLLVTLAFGVGIVPPLVEGIGPDFKVSTQLTPLFLFAPLVALGSLMISIAVATRRQSLVLMDELESQNAVLRSVANKAHLDADDLRRRVAALLHGPVQGRLSAAAMLLSLHLGHQSNRTLAEVVEETGKLIREASEDLAALSEPVANQHDPLELLRTLEQDWRGIVTVAWTFDPSAAPYVESDTALRATICELIVDMVTNAARHGRARNATLTVSVQSAAENARARVLEVRCSNDGTFAPATPSAGGLVRALLRSMDGDWVVSGTDGAVDSTARIPLQRALAHGARPRPETALTTV